MPLTRRWPMFPFLWLFLAGGPGLAYAQTAPLPASPTAVAAADGASVQLSGAARATAARSSSFAIDPGGARSSDASQGSSRITLRADLDSGRSLGEWSLAATVAADALSGTFSGQPNLQGDKLPGARWDRLVPAQAWGGLSLRDLGSLRVGLMTSHWGMGLVANDGGHALDSRRDEWFVLPTPGDRVGRAQLLLQPFGRENSALRGLFVVGSVDQVVEDGTAVRAQGDDARQQVAALRWHQARERWAGLYYVHRDQTFHSSIGPFLRVHVLDCAFDFNWSKAGSGLRLQGEAVLILGRTSLAPTPQHAEHDVRQSAAVARGRWDFGDSGVRLELDGGWFSGDDNLEDGALTAFKANPNYQQGILLFSQVMAWQSGRARLTASNPHVVGYPSADLDRLATGGSVTSAITAFPKIGWKASSFLQIYGGALLAWAPTTPIDPFSTRATAGGAPRNALGRAPDGSLLGTEFDLGAVATLAPTSWPIDLLMRGEYGLLLPGGVLAGMDGDAPVHGGRLSVALVPRAPAAKEPR